MKTISGASRAFTVRTSVSSASPMLVWAKDKRQAAAIASNPFYKVVSVQANYDAQNMIPRPTSWREYVRQVARN